MPQRTNPFQKLTTSIMAVFYEPEFKVFESVLVCNERTGAVREIDILVYHRQDVERNILVECRDYKRKQHVQWIDELEGKAHRLNFKKVIAVSSSGFTTPAIAEAEERGIKTLHLREAEELDWRRWTFGLDTFGLNIDFDLVVTEVRLIVPPSFSGSFPKSFTFDRVVLVDITRQTKCRLMDYIAGFQKDPQLKAKFAELDVNDAINHYLYTIPCDPGRGFVVEPSKEIIPLASLAMCVDSIRASYSIPLKHFDVEGKRVHVGESLVLGRDTRLVLHETKGQLKVMIEQRVDRRDTKDEAER